MAPPDTRFLLRHRIAALAAGAALGLTACAPAESDAAPPAESAHTPAAEHTPDDTRASPDTDEAVLLEEGIDRLEVAPERNADSYDRDAFGYYDRDTALAENRAQYGACEGYYSRYDDTCHTSADDVDIDETVARAEAWRSGAHSWGEARLDEFGGDPANLTVMTSEVNRYDKSDADPAEWRPQHDACVYLETWVQVKLDYGLTVDEAELAALEEMAASC